uniref:Uncharacterized protein n=1 Tax=Corethron hystrix TaxID=216773 RepID=A0A7S1FM46_9STRA
MTATPAPTPSSSAGVTVDRRNLLSKNNSGAGESSFISCRRLSSTWTMQGSEGDKDEEDNVKTKTTTSPWPGDDTNIGVVSLERDAWRFDHEIRTLDWSPDGFDLVVATSEGGCLSVLDCRSVPWRLRSVYTSTTSGGDLRYLPFESVTWGPKYIAAAAKKASADWKPDAMLWTVVIFECGDGDGEVKGDGNDDKRGEGRGRNRARGRGRGALHIVRELMPLPQVRAPFFVPGHGDDILAFITTIGSGGGKLKSKIVFCFVSDVGAEHHTAISLRGTRITSLCFREYVNGTIMVYGDDGGGVHVSSLVEATGEAPMRRYPLNVHPIQSLSIEAHGGVNAVDISPDGKWLCAGGDQGVIQIFDTDSWQSNKKITLSNVNTAITLLSYSRDSSVLFVDRSGYEFPSFYYVSCSKLVEANADVFKDSKNRRSGAMQWHPKELVYASTSASDKNMVNITDLTKSLQTYLNLPLNANGIDNISTEVTAISFSPDFSYAAVSTTEVTDGDRGGDIFFLRTSQQQPVIVGHKKLLCGKNVLTIRWSPNGTMLAVLTCGGVDVLNANRDMEDASFFAVTELASMPLTGEGSNSEFSDSDVVKDICFSPNGEFLLTAGSGLQVNIYDVEMGFEFTNYLNIELMISKLSNLIQNTNLVSKTKETNDSSDCHKASGTSHRLQISAMCFSYAGEHMALATTIPSGNLCHSNVVVLDTSNHDIKNWMVISIICCGRSAVPCALAWSPGYSGNGKFLAIGLDLDQIRNVGRVEIVNVVEREDPMEQYEVIYWTDFNSNVVSLDWSTGWDLAVGTREGGCAILNLSFFAGRIDAGIQKYLNDNDRQIHPTRLKTQIRQLSQEGLFPLRWATNIPCPKTLCAGGGGGRGGIIIFVDVDCRSLGNLIQRCPLAYFTWMLPRNPPKKRTGIVKLKSFGDSIHRSFRRLDTSI